MATSSDMGQSEVAEYALSDPEIPAWARALGASQRNVKNMTKILVRQLENYIKRSSTREEAEAIQEICRYADVVNTLRLPIAFGVGALIVRRTKAMRFPFWQSDPARHSIDFWPSISQPFLVGPRARSMWAGTRLLAWSAIAYIPASIGVTVYANVRTAQEIQRNPHLAGMVEMLKFRRSGGKREGEDPDAASRTRAWVAASPKAVLIAQRDKMQAEANARLEEIQAGEGQWKDKTEEDREKMYTQLKKAADDQFSYLSAAIAAKQDDPEQVARQQADYETLSGAGDYAAAPEAASYTGTTNTIGMSPKTSPWGPSAGTATAKGWSSNDAIDDDDASPVARGAAGSSGTSAWDRVRQQSQQGQSRPPQRQEDPWGSASSSEGDPKKVAQSEFDAMIERERRS